MTGTPRDRFVANWLQLREAADHRSRAGGLLPPLQTLKPAGRPWRILDLGAGSGSNLRYLAAHLDGPQNWLLADHDPDLLHLAAKSVRPIAPAKPHTLAVKTQLVDLRDQDAVARLVTEFRPHLVTASALLDLVSAHWLWGVTAMISAQRAAALFTLSVNGHFSIDPEAADDHWVQAAFNRHQLQRGPFGATLGPGAAACAQRLFRQRGYATRLAPSPWVLDCTLAADARLAQELVAGRVSAVGELDTTSQHKAQAWWPLAEQRILDGARVTVGHFDLLSVPAHGGSLRI